PRIAVRLVVAVDHRLARQLEINIAEEDDALRELVEGDLAPETLFELEDQLDVGQGRHEIAVLIDLQKLGKPVLRGLYERPRFACFLGRWSRFGLDVVKSAEGVISVRVVRVIAARVV